MGNVVTPILNGLGFSQLGNTDLSGTVRITEQLLKTAASPADVIAALNDLNKNVESFTSPDIRRNEVDNTLEMKVLSTSFRRIHTLASLITTPIFNYT